MRICSLTFRVQDAHSMNTAPKRYHCSSSQAFDDTPKMRADDGIDGGDQDCHDDRPRHRLADAFVEAVDGPAYSQERFHRCFPLTLYQL